MPRISFSAGQPDDERRRAYFGWRIWWNLLGSSITWEIIYVRFFQPMEPMRKSFQVNRSHRKRGRGVEVTEFWEFMVSTKTSSFWKLATIAHRKEILPKLSRGIDWKTTDKGFCSYSFLLMTQSLQKFRSNFHGIRRLAKSVRLFHSEYSRNSLVFISLLDRLAPLA